MNNTFKIIKLLSWVFLIVFPFALFATYVMTVVATVSRGSGLVTLGGVMLALYFIAAAGEIFWGLYSHAINSRFVKALAGGYLGLVFLAAIYIIPHFFRAH